MDSTDRFSNRVDAYVRYRPGYPDELVNAITEVTGLGPGTMVADIGSGTGISSEIFLRNGMAVHAVEPNLAMREAAEGMLANYEGFESIDGTAEATNLPDNSVELVVAAQAFHWFNREKALHEFRRILRPDGWVALFWNGRRTEGSKFLRRYEDLLLEFGTDYQQINHRNIVDADIESFFDPSPVTIINLENNQPVDFDGLKGRLDSSSYVPAPDDLRYGRMIEQLQTIFDETAVDGKVVIEYDLTLYLAQPGSEE